MTRPKTTTAVVQVLARALHDEINTAAHKIPWDGSGMRWLEEVFCRHARAQGLADVIWFAWDAKSREETLLVLASAETLDGLVELRYDNETRAINVVAVMGQQQDVQAACEVCNARVEYAVQDLPKTTQNEEP